MSKTNRTSSDSATKSHFTTHSMFWNSVKAVFLSRLTSVLHIFQAFLSKQAYLVQFLTCHTFLSTDWPGIWTRFWIDVPSTTNYIINYYIITFAIYQLKPYLTSKDNSLVLQSLPFFLILHIIHELFQTSRALQDALSGDLCDNGDAYIIPTFVIFCACDCMTKHLAVPMKRQYCQGCCCLKTCQLMHWETGILSVKGFLFVGPPQLDFSVKMRLGLPEASRTDVPQL